MKHLFFLLLLALISLASLAQTTSPSGGRVYRLSDQIVLADSAGNNAKTYPSSRISVRSDGTYVAVSVNALTIYYPFAKFLNQAGSPYSINSSSDAVTFFLKTGATGIDTTNSIATRNYVDSKLIRPRAGAVVASKVIAKLAGTTTALRYLIFGDSYAAKLANYIYPQLKLTMGGSRGGMNVSSTGDAPGIISQSGSVSGAVDYTKWPIDFSQIGAGGVATYGIGGVNATFNKVTIYYIKDSGGTFKVQLAGADVSGLTSVTTTGSNELSFVSFTPGLAQQALSIVGLTGTVSIVGWHWRTRAFLARTW